jgi:hypothetical protein
MALPLGANVKSLGKITIAVTAVTNAISRVAGPYTGNVQITSTTHGLAVGDTPVISDVTGTVEANGRHTVVEVVDANNFVIDVVFAVAYVAGGVVSLPKDLLGNYTDLRAAGTVANSGILGQKTNSIFVQALRGNSGTLFVGTRNMDRVSGAGVVVELAAGQTVSSAIMGGLNALSVRELFVDAANNGDGCYASYIPF